MIDFLYMQIRLHRISLYNIKDITVREAVEAQLNLHNS